MMTYRYEITGAAADGQTWKTDGTLKTAGPGEFTETQMMAMKDSFAQLTQGKAVFGKPGVGCRGPYRVTRMLIEEITQ